LPSPAYKFSICGLAILNEISVLQAFLTCYVRLLP
jgi:hypothetical protein